MTNTIIEALDNNEKRFKEAKQLWEKIGDIQSEKSAALEEIKNIYQIIFKNFNTERKKTKCLLPKNKERDRWNDKIIFINKNGISIKDKGDYGDNSDYINSYSINNFIEILKDLKPKEKELLPFIKEKKRKIFTDFLNIAQSIDLEKIELTKEIEPREVYIYNDYENKKKKILAKMIRIDNSGITLGKDNSVDLDGLEFEDKIIVEQIYDELKSILIEYSEIEKISLEKIKSIIDDLKDKFARQLIVNSFNK